MKIFVFTELKRVVNINWAVKLRNIKISAAFTKVVFLGKTKEIMVAIKIKVFVKHILWKAVFKRDLKMCCCISKDCGAAN